MTVLDLDPPHPTLRLVSSNGSATTRDSRYRSTTPLYGDARELFQQVLQYALENQITIDPDSLRIVLGTKQAIIGSTRPSILGCGHLATHVC